MEMKTLLQDAMKRAVDNQQVAGVNLLVVKDGAEVCYLEEGYADVENKKPISRDSIFRLYSQSKPITGAAAMILLERGIIELCQPVSDFLPGFQDAFVWDGITKRIPMRGVSVQDLLNMTSGALYADPTSEAGRQAARIFDEAQSRLDTDHPMTTQEISNALGSSGLAFVPGSEMRYGTSADILGAVIEVASGMTFGEFLKKELFGPLGMEDTDFWVPAEKQERLAHTYATVKKDGKNELKLFTEHRLDVMNRMEKRPAFESGGAGIASTLDDYLRFSTMLLRGGELDGTRILQENTVKFFTGSHLTEQQQRTFENWWGLGGFSYANLMRVCVDPGQAQCLARKGEYGWDGWLGSYFANFPTEQMTILMGMQKTDAGTWELTRKLRNILLSHI